jgi:hypothetical protein
MLKILIPANLTLFDEGGGGSAPAGAASSGGAAVGGEAVSETKAQAPAGRGAKNTGAFESAASGGTPDAAGPDAGGEANPGGDAAFPPKTPEERRAEYERLREEYKDLLSEDFQKTFNRRFRAAKETEAAFRAQSDFLNKLHRTHGTKTVDELDRALTESDAALKLAADRTGTEAGTGRDRLGVVLSSAGFLRAQDEKAAAARDDKLIRGVVEEAAALMADPEFGGSTWGGSLGTRFQEKAPVRAEREVRLSGKVLRRSGGKRAAECGKRHGKARCGQYPGQGKPSSGKRRQPRAGKVYVNDVSKLTKAQRAQAAKRAQKGENITFR